ncbi:MAG: DUF799 family lipoprotein [Elusimicrobia bacterium]|nr:DUF799 family lipoprotein [Elusimicrobiota bacterium]
MIKKFGMLNLMSKRKYLAAISLLIVTACGPKAPVVHHGTPFPATVALLPMSNLSVDLQGPLLLRRLMQDALIGVGFDLSDVDMVDGKLRTIGITDGGQLNSTTPQKLGELLGIEALMYGELIEFKRVNIGIYANRVVEARFWLVDANTGEKLWEGSQKKSNKKIATSSKEMKDIFIEGMASKVIENVLKSPLKEEADHVVFMITKELGRVRKDW